MGFFLLHYRNGNFPLTENEKIIPENIKISAVSSDMLQKAD